MSVTSSTMSTPMTSPDYPMPFGHYEGYTSATSSTNGGGEPMKREKRKYRCRVRSPETIERAKKQRRDKANARERRRMNSLNDALEHLRTKLPQMADEPKMTKIETLRVAQWYIRMLGMMLEEGTADNVENFDDMRERVQKEEGLDCTMNNM